MDNQPTLMKPVSQTKKIAVATALTLGAITVIAIVLAFLSNSTKYSDDVSVLSAQQLEAVRIASVGHGHDNASQAIKNYAITVEVALLSANQVIRDLPGSLPSTSVQEQYRDTSVEKTLDDSASINQFNPKFVEIIQLQLNEVLDQAKLVLTKVPEDDKDLMQKIIDDTQLLLDKAPG